MLKRFVLVSSSLLSSQVVRFCLRKNPRERPNCAGLLSKKFFKRKLLPDIIVNEMLVHVPVVGEEESPAVARRNSAAG